MPRQSGEKIVWYVDDVPVDFVGLWRMAHKAGYNPVPFCTFHTTDAAEHLRKKGRHVVEPVMPKWMQEYRKTKPK
jgi:hypothetical protein